MREFRVGGFYVEYNYRVKPPRCLMDVFRKLFPCHPSYDNTFILVRVFRHSRETGFKHVVCYWVCTHFEHSTSEELVNLLDFMEILRRFFGAALVSLDFLDPVCSETLVIGLDYVRRFLPDVSTIN